MCIRSVISDYGSQYPSNYWNQQNWPPFRDLLTRADEVDRVTHQPECVDPKKDEWVKKIEDRLRDLELGTTKFTAVTVDPRWMELHQLKQRIRELEQQLGI